MFLTGEVKLAEQILLRGQECQFAGFFFKKDLVAFPLVISTPESTEEKRIGRVNCKAVCITDGMRLVKDFTSQKEKAA